MRDLLSYLSPIPTAVTLVIGFVILWRSRRRSRKATAVAFAGLTGLAGLWLFGIVFWVLWRTQQVPDPDFLTVLTVYTLGHACINAACILLLVIATVTDRPAPGQLVERNSGPAADFDDAHVGGPSR